MNKKNLDSLKDKYDRKVLFIEQIQSLKENDIITNSEYIYITGGKQ